MSSGRDRMNRLRCELGSRDIVRLGIHGKRAKLRDKYDCKTAWPWGKSAAPHLCREKHQNCVTGESDSQLIGRLSNSTLGTT